MKKGKKKWLFVGLAAALAAAQALATAGVAPPVLAEVLMVLADGLLPAEQ